MNDEKTTTFYGLDIGLGQEELGSLIECVNDVMKQFNKKPFYEVTFLLIRVVNVRRV